MKKLISILMLGVALPALAQFNNGFQTRDFFGGNQTLFLTNNTTYTYGNSNYYYTNALSVPVASLTNLYWTNAIGTGTLYTNSNIGVYGPAWVDVPGFGDKNGNGATASIAICLTGANASATNGVTFTFEKLVRYAYTSANGADAFWTNCTGANDKFTVGVTNIGAGTLCLTTNLPATFVNGAGKIRLQTIAVTDASVATSLNFNACQLTGFIYPNN